MEDLSYMVVQQVRLFTADAIPFFIIRTAPGTEHLKNLFSFKEAFLNEQGELALMFGIFAPEEGSPIPINVVTIGERKIVLNIGGNSNEASAFYAALVAANCQLSPDSPLASVEPVVMTQETTTSAKLAFHWQDLLAPRAVAAVEDEILQEAGREHAASIKSVGLKIVLAFMPSEEIKKYGITLSDKTIVLEPRINTPLEDRIFFVTTPFDSATHLRLVEGLEQALASSAE